MTFLSAYLSDLQSPPIFAECMSLANGNTVEYRPKASENALGFSIITTRSAFDQLENDWCDLFKRAGSGRQVFQNFHWLWHWCNHFLDENQSCTELAVLTGRKDGKLALVWPLAKTCCYGLTQIVWMGHPVSQYGDALVDRSLCSDHDLKKSWQFLTATIKADEILLRKVRDDAAIGALVHAEFGAPISTQSAPYLDLSDVDTFDAYQKRYSGKTRKNRRRLRRRAEERAPLSVATHETGSIRAELAGRAVALKRRWLKARGLLSVAIQDDRTERFFVDAAASERHPTGCRATALQIGNQTAAIEISFVAKQHCAVHVIVYHMDYEKAGAGVLLMEDGIRSAIDAGIKTFDLMAPGDNYKLDWADGAMSVHDWSMPLSQRGQVYAQLKLNKLPPILKKIIGTLPLKLRQLIHGGVACAL